MRLSSLESAKREKKVSRRMQDVRTYGPDVASGADGLSFFFGAMSSPASSLSKIRTRLKKRIRIFSVNSNRIFKRGMDVCGSLTAIILLLPLFLFIAIWLKLDSPGPLIYRQIRIGLHGRPFYFYKFRSMYIDSEARRAALEKTNESKDGVLFKMKNDPRITRCGRFIRKYSIDEAPQFFNVLLGDMSLVGPRPPLPSEVAQYSLDDRKRLEILPGITCIWQISGRSDIPFREQVVLDKEYIRGQSFWKDILILFKTIPAVLAGKGAY